MARKVKTLTIDSEGRDKGKVFVITEMAARAAHAWATRALFAVMNGGVDIPENILQAGFAGIAAVGVKALGNVHVDQAQPLLDELFACVQALPDPSKPNITRSLVDTDTEEVSTLFKLQMEVLALHVDFSIPAAR